MAPDVWRRLAEMRVLPVVTLDDPAVAEPLAAALIEAGLPAAEITFRTAAGEPALRRLSRHPELLLGAGTVLTPEQVDRAADAGAAFVVSPGTSTAVLDRARERGIPALPGVATASEVQAAVAAGAGVLKLFPVEILGGLALIDQLLGPFPDIRIVPSGGVTEANAAAYLAHPAVPAVSGSWVAPRALLAAGDFAEIGRIAKRTVAALGTAS